MVTREQQTSALRAVASAVVSAVAESPCGIGEGPLCMILESKGMKWEHARKLVDMLCDYGILLRNASHRITAGPNAAAFT